ncbi:CCCH zinc finger protein [Aspergillus udagawae]|uniref:C3H1-type domain-containing protein n=1 Tax=Aspergillus udagawae TaxID=91492 RepID=A0A8E0V3K4_9EURO|nr:uncharacterized protein Aud_009197 [Aspergillus udagawae]GIC92726.1 hypothetical protein Aud_009197 [Aspergillus udagawae]
MTEDQELMAKISQLAGQINRHKNQTPQAQAQAHPDSDLHAGPYVSRHTRARAGWAPYRGRPYGRGRAAAPHRHRTLVLNNANSGNSAGSTPGPTKENVGEPRSVTPNGWVAKRDRHMQLINSAIYDKEAQARAKAMEQTRKAKAEKKAQIEQAKVLRYAQGFGGPRHATSVAPQVSATTQPQGEYQVYLNDIPFRIAKGGSKLVRVSDDPNTANITPKKVTVAGVTFVRSKNGNLHRLGAVTSRRKPTAVKKRNELCKRFTSTGACYKGPSCPFIHDPNKVAICKEFLQTGNCAAGQNCDLSHEPSPHRSPVCVHFLRNRCSNPDCRYSHVRVTPGAPVCRDFANLGYCDKGAECEERHVHECPDYAATGVCNKKRCRLPHVDRAGQIRKNAATKADAVDEEESDESSEEEEYDAIDSDDVDSDDLEDEPEYVEGADNGEQELFQQNDFIRF